MVGSEGTLGFVASAVFRTVAVLPHVATGLVVFEDLSSASAAVPELLEDRRRDGRAAGRRVAAGGPAGSRMPGPDPRLEVDQHAALLVELQAGPRRSSTAAGRSKQALGRLPLSHATALTADAAERAALWRIRKGLYTAVAGARPSGTSALLEDVAVPVRSSARSARLTAMIDPHGYDESVIFGHARDGNLHFMLNERSMIPTLLRRYEAFTADMVDLVLGLDGTLKAEHGTGRIMAPFVERQYGDELYDVMRDAEAAGRPARRSSTRASVLADDPRPT